MACAHKPWFTSMRTETLAAERKAVHDLDDFQEFQEDIRFYRVVQDDIYSMDETGVRIGCLNSRIGSLLLRRFSNRCFNTCSDYYTGRPSSTAEALPPLHVTALTQPRHRTRTPSLLSPHPDQGLALLAQLQSLALQQRLQPAILHPQLNGAAVPNRKGNMGDTVASHWGGQGAGKRVIIIGSGCTGLAIAHGLKKAGISATIFEKNATRSLPGERDWNMGLHWAMPILKSLVPDSASAKLQSVQVDPNEPTKPIDVLSFINGATGEVMSAPEVPYFYRLRRSKLRALLANGLDIRWNKRLNNVVYEQDGSSVTAVFEDGEHVTGALLVGADGSRSTVRTGLLGPDIAASTRLPYAATFVQARYTREQALFLRSFHPLFLASPHPDGLFSFFGLQDAPEVDKPEGWTFFFYISWNSSIEQQDEEAKTYDNKDRLKQVRELSKGYTQPWKSAFEWLPDDQPAWYFGLTAWDPSLEDHKWDNRNGRVTLVGDAAHPMTYQRGQGLNHSISDAGKLVGTLKTESSIASAIENYEAEMKARAGEEVRLGVMNTTMLHDWAKVLESPVFKAGLTRPK